VTSIIDLYIKIYKTLILPFIFYGCENWYFNVMEEFRLRAFEKRMLEGKGKRSMKEIT
jgi:hypothetical protein